MSTRHRTHLSKEVGYDVPGSAHKANNEYSIDEEAPVRGISKVHSE